MITLQSIQLKNFLSHKDTKLKFHPTQKLLIDGESGSGKSSIVEGVIWALYGKGRSDNKNLIRRGSSEAEVIIDLVDEDKTYQIKRSVDKKAKQTITVLEDGKPILSNGVKGNQEYIENTILKSSYLLFINSIIYLQDNIDTFVRQTASKKKDILLEIINASGYDEWLKKTKEALNDIKTSQAVNNAKIEGLLQQILSLEYDVAKLKELEVLKVAVVSKIDMIKMNIKDNSEQKESILRLQSKNDAELSVMSSNEKKIASNKDKIDNLKKELKEDNTEDIKEQKKKLLELPELKAKYSHILELQQKEFDYNKKKLEIEKNKPLDLGHDRDIERINKEIISIMTEEVPTCKKCGAPYDEFETKKNEKLSKLTAELDNANSNKKDYESSLDNYKKSISELGEIESIDYSEFTSIGNKINELEKLDAIIREMESKNNNKDFTEKEIELLEKENEELSKEVAGADKLREAAVRYSDALVELNNYINKVNEDLRVLQSEESSIDAKIEIANESKIKIEKLKSEIEEIKLSSKKDTDAQESLELLKEAFGQNGIRAMVIDYVLPQLEDKINEILGTLSDFQIKIETQRQGASEDTVLEGLFIDIINPQGEVMDFDNFSGGEKIKISVAINEALAELSKVNFRILDETIVSLDNESTQKFLEALNNIQSKVGQVLCVSHIPEVKDIFEERILVKKLNGISKIEK